VESTSTTSPPSRRPLTVSVGRLLMPDVSEDDEVPVTPNRAVAGWALWQWLEGAHALPEDVEGTLDPARDVAFRDERPTWVRWVEQHPLAVAQGDLWRTTRRVLLAAFRGYPQGVRGHLPAARTALDRVATQLDEVAPNSEETRRG
jgi:hypothetical protein